jgi:hypothetical protein
MPLEILVLMVVLGVGGVVAAVHLSGGSRTGRIDDAEATLARFRIDFPHHTGTRVQMSDDAMSAILYDDDGRPVGLVVVMGRKSITRHFDATPVLNVSDNDGTLVLALRDVTLPNFAIAISDINARIALHQSLRNMIHPKVENNAGNS